MSDMKDMPGSHPGAAFAVDYRRSHRLMTVTVTVMEAEEDGDGTA